MRSRSRLGGRAVTAVALFASLALVGCHEPAGQSTASSETASATVPQAPANAATATDRLSAYTPVSKVSGLSTCNLERVDDLVFQAKPIERSTTQAHSFSGWIAAPSLNAPTFWLRFDDKQANRRLQVRLNPTGAREDVAELIGKAALNSGFKVSLPGDSLPVGKYHVYLAAQSGGITYICDNGRYVDAAH